MLSLVIFHPSLVTPLHDIVSASLDRHAQRQQKVIPDHEPAASLALDDTSPSDWRRVVDVLAPFMKEKRVRSQIDSLNKRRSGLHLCLENVADPFNAAGVLRTAEALGIQHIHVIESVSLFQLPANVAHASARGALGRADASGDAACRWLSIHRHKSTAAAVRSMRDEFGLRIYVSDCPTVEPDEEGD